MLTNTAQQYFKNKIFLLALFNLVNCLIEFCENYQDNNSQNSNCIKCQQGFILQKQQDEEIQKTNICIGDCYDFLFWDVELKTCTSFCQKDWIGDSTLKVCRKVDLCPSINGQGNQFHSGSVNGMLIVNQQIGDKQFEKLISYSNQDKNILQWDLQKGTHLSTLRGHTQPVIKVVQGKDSKQILSISSSGEIIIWDHEKGLIMINTIIPTGFLTERTSIDIQNNKIVSFGFQGEFFIFDYLTSTNQRFIGHSNIVLQSILYKDSTRVITSSSDSNIFLWILNNNSYEQQNLCTHEGSAFGIVVSQSFQGYILFSYGGISSDFNKVKISALEQQQNKCSLILADLNDQILNLIYDYTSETLITYSSKEIIIYKHFNQEDNQAVLLKFNLIERNSQLIESNFLELKYCKLNQQNLITISSTGNLKIFEISKLNQQGSIVLQLIQEKTNQFNKSKGYSRRATLNGVIIKKYQSNNQNQGANIFFYGEQIYSFNYESGLLKYIINNLVIPFVKHISKVTYVDFDLKQQLSVSSSEDGLAMSYNYKDGELIGLYKRPVNNIFVNSGAKCKKVLIVSSLPIICALYDDNFVCCYHVYTTQLQFYFKFDENIVQIFKDNNTPTILVSTLNTATSIKISDGTIIKKITIQGAFYYSKILDYKVDFGNSRFLTTTQTGRLIYFLYPSLDILVDSSSISNVYQSSFGKIIAFSPNENNNMILSYFDSGKIFVVPLNFQIIVQDLLNYPITSCGLFGYFYFCNTLTGYIVARTFDLSFKLDRQLYNYPLLDGDILFKQSKGFLLSNMGSFGGIILIYDTEIYAPSQKFQSPLHLVGFQFDELNQKVAYYNEGGDVMVSHYNAQTNIKLLRNQDISVINLVQIINKSTKLVVLSNQITIIDFIQNTIYKENKFHLKPVLGCVLDEYSKTIYSYNNDKTNNLLKWNYEIDKSFPLDGHTSAVNGVQIVEGKNQIISFGDNGQVIVWDLSKDVPLKLKQISPHQDQSILGISIHTTISNTIISYGIDDQVIIMNFIDNYISKIISSPKMKGFQYDIIYQRIFIYGSNIIVYNTINGNKITDLIGFDISVQDVILKDNYIIAYSNQNIQSIDRSSLKVLFTDKFQKTIYKVSVLKNLVGMIGNSVNEIIEVWDYTTGIMKQELKNQFYSDPFSSIICDEYSNLFIVSTNTNLLFTFDPYSVYFSKIKDFIFPIKLSNTLVKDILIDKNINKLIFYNSKDIVVWNFFLFLGLQGQVFLLPSLPLIKGIYNQQKDKIVYNDLENNVWQMNDNNLQNVLQLQYLSLFFQQLGNYTVTGDGTNLYIYNSDFILIDQLSSVFICKILILENINTIFGQTFKNTILQIQFNMQNQKFMTPHLYEAGHASRIQKMIIVPEYNHLLALDVSGFISISQFQNLNFISITQAHSNVIYKIQFDATTNRYIFKKNYYFFVTVLLLINWIQIQYLEFEFLIYQYSFNHQIEDRRVLRNNDSFLKISFALYNLQIYLFYKKQIRLFTCSYDGFLKVFKYTKDKIEELSKIQFTTSVDQISFNKQNQELIIWNNLQQLVQIRDSSTFEIKQNLIAPGDYLVKLFLSEQYNQLIIFNPFQINFYMRDSQGYYFINYLRYPSIINSILYINLLSSDLLITKTRIALHIIRIKQINLNTSQKPQFDIIIEQTFSMNFPHILQQELDTTRNTIKLKGINFYSVFNYTFQYENYNQQNSYKQVCQNNIILSNFAFKFEEDLLQQYNSLQNLNQDINLITYNIDLSQTSEVYLLPHEHQSSNVISQKKEELFIYDKNLQNLQIEKSVQENQKVQFFNFQDFNTENIVLKNFQWKFVNNSQINFNEWTQSLSILNTLVTGQISNVSIKINGLKKLIVDQLLFDGASILFDQSNSQNKNSLFQIQSTELVYINKLIIKNSDLQEGSLFQIFDTKYVYIEEVEINNVKYKINRKLQEVNDQEIKSDDSSTQSTSNEISNEMLSKFIYLFKLQNCFAVKIKNVKIKNQNDQYVTKTPFFVFSLDANLSNDIINITAEYTYNIQLLKISSVYQQENQDWHLKNDVTNVSKIKLQNCQNYQIYPLIIFFSSYIELKDSDFTQLKCNQSKGCAVFISESKFRIFGCKFDFNIASSGGALYVQNSLNKENLISDSQFTNNLAYMGGAIFLYNSDLDMQSTQIQKNSATIGGGIRYLVYIPQFLQKNKQNNTQTKNTINDNKGSIFGNNVASYPRSLKLQFKDNNLNYKQEKQDNNGEYFEEYLVEEFRSSDILKFGIQLLDEEGQVIKYSIDEKNNPIVSQELKAYLIFCEKDSDLLQISGNPQFTYFDSQQLQFIFDNLILRSPPPSSSVFQIINQAIQIPDEKNPNYFKAKTKSVKVKVNFRKCQIGEIFVNGTEYPASCYPCPEMKFSLIEPKNNTNDQVCKICPVEASFCYRDVIILKDGYWRENNMTDQIHMCSNNQDNCQRDNRSSIDFYCKQGYIGPLCEQCDVDGQVWNQTYVNVRPYECVSCIESTSINLSSFFAVICTSVYLFLGIKQIIQTTELKIICYYLRMMNILSIGNSDRFDQSDVYLKLFTNFMQISTLVFSIDSLNILNKFSFLFGFPIDLIKHSGDCQYFIGVKNLDRIYYRLLLSQFIAIVYLLLLFFVYVIVEKVILRRKQINKNYLISGVIFVFLFLQPNIIYGLSQVMACRKIGNKQYISADLTLECYSDTHIKFILFLVIPLFFLWIFIIPLVWFFRLRRNSNKLDLIVIRLRYGPLYTEYKQNQYYWEFLKITVKVLIIFISTFFADELYIKNTLVTLILLLYLLLAIKISPYKSNILNRSDQLGILIIILCVQLNFIKFRYLGVYSVYAKITNYFQYAINYSFICFQIGKIIKYKMRKYYVKFSMRFPCLIILSYKIKLISSFLGLQKINQMRAFKNWRKAIKYITIHLAHKNQLNNQISHSVKQQKIENSQLNLTSQLAQSKFFAKQKTVIDSSLCNQNKIENYNQYQHLFYEQIKTTIKNKDQFQFQKIQ